MFVHSEVVATEGELILIPTAITGGQLDVAVRLRSVESDGFMDKL